MKRLLFINPRLATGGAERQIVTVACLLKQSGYSVDFLCYSYGDFFENTLKKEGIKVYWKQHNYLFRLISCTRFIQKGNYDVVISFLPTPCFINCFSAMIRKKWKVITGERSSVVKRPRNIFEKFSLWLYRYSDVIVCNSDNARHLWESTYPHLTNKMMTIHNAVLAKCDDNATYSPRKNDKLHICVAARFSHVKNSIGVINALLQMTVEERNRFVIDWYGMQTINLTDSSVYDETRRLIENNGLESCFITHEETNDIMNKMWESDCVALFSKYEGFPNTICEGMTIGKPVILSRVSDYDLIVENNGILCDWDNPASIKDAILTMAGKSIAELESMGKESKKKAEALFSPDVIKDMWINIIENNK